LAANWSTGKVPAATDIVRIALPVGATVSISSGTARAASLDSACGLTLSGGALELSGDGSISGSFVQTGGTLTGSGTLTLAGADSTWTGGTMTGGGTTVIAGGATLSIGGGYGGRVYLGDRTLRNEGTIIDQGDRAYGVVVDLDGAVVLDNEGGTLQFTHGNGWQDIGGNSGSSDSLRIQGSGAVSLGTLAVTNTAVTLASDFSLDGGDAGRRSGSGRRHRDWKWHADSRGRCDGGLARRER